MALIGNEKGKGVAGKDMELAWERTLQGVREIERVSRRWQRTLDNELPEQFSSRAKGKYLLFYARLVMLAMDAQEAIKAMESEAASQLVCGNCEGDHDEY